MTLPQPLRRLQVQVEEVLLAVDVEQFRLAKKKAYLCTCLRDLPPATSVDRAGQSAALSRPSGSFTLLGRSVSGTSRIAPKAGHETPLARASVQPRASRKLPCQADS